MLWLCSCCLVIRVLSQKSILVSVYKVEGIFNFMANFMPFGCIILEISWWVSGRSLVYIEFLKNILYSNEVFLNTTGKVKVCDILKERRKIPTLYITIMEALRNFCLLIKKNMIFTILSINWIWATITSF